MSALIAIAPDFDSVGRTSVEPEVLAALSAAGLEPRIVEECGEAAGTHGVMLCGGAFDIPPAWYGQDAVARVDPPRERRSMLERELLEWADRSAVPVLGVCGGAQLMAVSRGGTLIQDLATQRPGALDHERGVERTCPVHDVLLEADSRLAGIVEATRVRVNSTHHQSIDQPGARVRVVGRAPDGVVEAIESPDPPFWIGVQWHPERLDDAASTALMRAFAVAAGSCSRRG